MFKLDQSVGADQDDIKSLKKIVGTDKFVNDVVVGLTKDGDLLAAISSGLSVSVAEELAKNHAGAVTPVVADVAKNIASNHAGTLIPAVAEDLARSHAGALAPSVASVATELARSEATTLMNDAVVETIVSALERSNKLNAAVAVVMNAALSPKFMSGEALDLTDSRANPDDQNEPLILGEVGDLLSKSDLFFIKILSVSPQKSRDLRWRVSDYWMYKEKMEIGSIRTFVLGSQKAVHFRVIDAFKNTCSVEVSIADATSRS